MRIVIDIDGTICETKKHGQTYENVRVNPGAVEKIKALKDAGHYIILQTARHMKSMNGDVAKVIEKVGPVTEKWLKHNNIVYDELHFGKPYNQIIIDDRSFWFQGWENFNSEDFNANKINIVINLNQSVNPFQKVHGKSLVEWTVNSFKELENKFTVGLIFVISPNNQKFRESLIEIFGEKIAVLENECKSSLDLSQAVEPLVNNLQQLVIIEKLQVLQTSIYTNITEESNLYGAVVYAENSSGEQGGIVNDQWGFIAETTEEKVQSQIYSTGINYFRTGRDYLSCIKCVNKKSEVKRVISCYNELISRGQQVKAVKAHLYWDLGSTAAISNFETNYKIS